jgi:hypothetical protein
MGETPKDLVKRRFGTTKQTQPEEEEKNLAVRMRLGGAPSGESNIKGKHSSILKLRTRILAPTNKTAILQKKKGKNLR